MKKTLLLGAALIFGVAGYSQNAKVKAGIKSYKKLGVKKAITTNEIAGNSVVKGQKKGAHNNSVNSGCVPSHVSSSYAASGILDISTAANSSNRNFLTYNHDLNTVVFVHRASADWSTEVSTTTPYGLGSIHATWWPVGNIAAQDSMIIYHSSTNTAGATVNSFRYPSGTIFNPIGNTDIKKSFMVATGENLTGSNYAGVCYAVRQPSVAAVYHVNPTDDQRVSLYGTWPFGNCGGFNGGAPVDGGQLFNDLQQVGNMVAVAGPLQDVNMSTTTGLGVKGFVIGYGKHMGTLGSGDSLAWSADSITPGMYITTSSQASGTAGDGYVGDMKPRIAFGADGQTGYAVVCGRLATNFNTSADSMVAPIVYKTTNAGGSWTPVLHGYDWAKNHPEVAKGVGAMVFTSAPRHWNFNNDNPDGCDLVVDNTGTLHFVCTVQEVTNDGAYADSLGYSYNDTTHYDYINHRPMIWDFMTDGTCWKTMLVDSINTNLVSGSSTDPSNAFGTWGLSGSFEGLGAHITVGRSYDGSAVFYGWADSDPAGQGWASSSTGLKYNVTPDLLMKAYDVANHTISDKKNITNGNELAFYPYISDLEYFDGTAWVVPAVYVPSGRSQISASNPQGVVYSVNTGIDYKYTDCGTFTAAEMAAHTVTLTCTTVTGIKKTTNAFESSISNYPNPFNNNTTIAVTLSEAKSFNVNVYNAIGTLVYSKKVNGNVGDNAVTFDGSALSSGVYYYTVSAGAEQATKKMIIQK